jgi:DNA-binding transcriptional LysR family regulator
MDLQDLRIFARVAAIRSLSAVGTELGLTPGTISKRIQALESDLRVRLFNRTTRSIRITEEGMTFLAHVERILLDLEKARASIGDNLARPQGKLKISACGSIGRAFVAPAICGFMRAYPDIAIQVDLGDRLVNLQAEGYDAAIRTGVLSDSGLIAIRLAPDRQVVVASPAYLEIHGRPRTPEDLARHNCFVLGDNRQWIFARGKRSLSVPVSGRLRSNHSAILRCAALDGQGLLQTSEWHVREDLAAGRLARVLSDYEVIADSAVWAVYPRSKHVLPRLEALIEFLAKWHRVAVGEPGLEKRTPSQPRKGSHNNGTKPSPPRTATA